MTKNDKTQNDPERKFVLEGVIPQSATMVMVYATFPNPEAAEAAGRSLVEDKLAGCINILGPMVSIYSWTGTMERAEEVVLIAKTTAVSAEACMRAIHSRHPYEMPAVFALPVVAGSADYLAWIGAGTG